MVRTLSILAEPVIPNSARKVWKILNISSNPNWDEAGKLKLQAGQVINQPEILFTKIEDNAIDAEIERLQKIQVNLKGMQKPVLETEPLINFDLFKKIDLRVAKVLEAEAVKKSDKLLKLQIELGNTKRQIIAGIAQHYKPEDLIGKKIIVVANLEPATIRGNQSEGMLLAALDDNKLTLLTILDDIPSGAKIS